MSGQNKTSAPASDKQPKRLNSDPATNTHSLWKTVRKFFSPARRATIELHVNSAAPSGGTLYVKARGEAVQPSAYLAHVDQAFALASEAEKPGLLLSAVRVAFHDAIEKDRVAGAGKSKANGAEMQVSMLNSTLSKMLSSSAVSDDDLQFIQTSVMRFEDRLPSAIRASLNALIQGQYRSLAFGSHSSRATSPEMQALSSPANSKREAGSEQMTGIQAPPLRAALNPDQLKLRALFESECRQSFENAKKLPLEWIVSTASTELKKIMLEHPGEPVAPLIPSFTSRMQQIFERKFDHDVRKGAELAAYVEGSMRAALRSSDQRV